VRFVISRSDFTLDEQSVNYDMSSRYFWTKNKALQNSRWLYNNARVWSTSVPRLFITYMYIS